MPTKSHPPTHRCNSLPTGMSIRLTKITYPILMSEEHLLGQYKWTLSQYYEDWDYDTKGIREICHIEYCPFCGEKLKINIDKQ